MVHHSPHTPTPVPVNPGPIAPGPIAQRYRAVRSMIVDYALGMAIIGLNPFRSMLTLTLYVACGMMLQMVWDIRCKWRGAGTRNLLAIASYLFNVLGALALGFMALLTFMFIGVFVPVMTRFGLSAALMTVTWIVGAATNQYFLNGYLSIEGDAPATGQVATGEPAPRESAPGESGTEESATGESHG